MSNNNLYNKITAKHKAVIDAILKLETYKSFKDADEKVVEQLLADLKVVLVEVSDLQTFIGKIRTSVGSHYNDLRKKRGKSKAKPSDKTDDVVLE